MQYARRQSLRQTHVVQWGFLIERCRDEVECWVHFGIGSENTACCWMDDDGGGKTEIRSIFARRPNQARLDVQYDTQV